MRFVVALSFPGEHRSFVARVANQLAAQFGKERILYDRFHEAEFARPNLDNHLQNLYHDESELVVVFLGRDYERKQWPGVEWRAIRDIIKQKKDTSVMFVRLDSGAVSGNLPIDGYVDAGRSPTKIARLIIERLRISKAGSGFQTLAELLAKIMNDDWRISEAALQKLTALDRWRTLPQLAKFKKRLIADLQATDANVRAKAAEVLGHIDGPGVSKLLLELLDDPWEYPRASAIRSLGSVGDSNMIPQLISALNDPSWWVQREAADALGQVGDARAVRPLLRKMLRKPVEKEAGCAAFLAIAEIINRHLPEITSADLRDYAKHRGPFRGTRGFKTYKVDCPHAKELAKRELVRRKQIGKR